MLNINISQNSIRTVSNSLYETKLVKKTNLDYCERLSNRFDCQIYLKREDQQIIRSFKIRGALNKIKKIHNKNNKNINGFVCASAGNHAQGVALSSKYFKYKCKIFVPICTPLQKISRIKKFCDEKGEIIITGDNFSETLEIAKKHANEEEMIFVHPYDDYDIIEGQGTIATEILDDIIPDIIICGVGGGGLLSGLAIGLNGQSIVIGIESSSSASMITAIKNDQPTNIEIKDSFVDGACVSQVGDKTYKICQDLPIFEVCNGLVASELVELYNQEGIIAEPAGILSIAGLNMIPTDVLKDKKIVCIVSGGNNDIEKYPEILRRSLEYKNLIHYFLVKFNQVPGQLKKFIEKVLSKDDDIIRFEYTKKLSKDRAFVLVGIQVSPNNSIEYIIENMTINNFKYQKLTENDLCYELLV